MFDERSFSSTSFSPVSWWLGVVTQVVRALKQVFARTLVSDLFVRTRRKNVL